MAELALVVLAAALVNNLVLVQLLGVCPLFGASGRVETAMGTALVTGLVLTIAAVLTHVVDRYVLLPLQVPYLRLLAFVVAVGAAVACADFIARRGSPQLTQLLGFGLALVLCAGLRERLAQSDVPVPFRGPAIVFVTAGILSLAFLGFAGFARL
jgi:electron transport complex protein RnfA